MDIVRFKGGLGNQMFQYAFLKALSSQGREVMGSLGYYAKYPQHRPFCLTDVFENVSLNIVDETIFEEIDKKWILIKQDKERREQYLKDYTNRFFWVEEADGTYDPRVFETSNCVFTGYWQTEKYFVQIRDTLLSDFRFSKGEQKLEEMKNKLLGGRQYVSVHIRRGDYLETPDRYWNICTRQYYDAAMAYAEKKVENPVFVFFSDDLEWTREQFQVKDAVFIEAGMFDCYQPWYDMCLMSCCSCNIIANSTFSWWGAWLNQRPEKTVVAPVPWFHGFGMIHICPEKWVRING